MNYSTARGGKVSTTALLAALALGCGSSSKGVAPTPPQPDAAPVCPDTDAGASTDPATFAAVPVSCAYSCPLACPESTTGYVCPSMGDLGCIPHADACNGFDGGAPAVTPGQCTVSAPSGEAAKYAGPDGTNVLVLPDGRRITPAGSDWAFQETDLVGGLTTAIVAVPGTNLVLTVDDGSGDHAVRAIDVTKIGSGNPVVSYVKFANPATLNSGITFVTPDLVLVATNDGIVQALTLDTTASTLAMDATRTIKLPPSMDGSGDVVTWYVASVAASPDGTRLAVTGVNDTTLLVYDLTAGATYGTMLGSVDLGAAETFAVAFDPNDATGHYAYVSMWGTSKVLQVDVSVPSAPKVTHTYATEKDPQGLAFLDARWLAVADDFGESLSLVDRTAGTVTSVPVDVATTSHGYDVSGVAYDATNKRLYATLSGINAVGAWSVDTTKTPPAILPLGRLPTAWWPGGVTTMADGSVIVASMREHGVGPTSMHYDVGDGDITDPMRGGIQRVALPSAATLTSGEATVATNLAVSKLAGAPAVTCPPGVSDFPVPPTNTAGPSPSIQHVFFIVRENKDYDGLFGDLPGGNGDASLTLKTAAGQMDRIWTNLRDLARTFTFSDNYYTDAELSTQGHVWTTYGRSNDFNERTWAISGDGRNARPVPGGGVFTVGQPVEGSLFDWLGNNGVSYDILGEIVGSPQTIAGMASPIDIKYPGGPFQSIAHSDSEKACHIAARARVLCDFSSFAYVTLPNDHTIGVSESNASPETMCAVNDEATGMAVDAISHSPFWASSVIFITEDDPSQGGEHVDNHRTPLVVISPWVKRGTVSHTHTDVASVHKLFAHIFGKPYPNVEVANAGLPLEMFTSTPDYTPYTYAPRTFPLVCGDASSKWEGQLTASWEFDEPDEQPGLDAQVTRWMRGHPLQGITPRLERQIEARLLRRGVRGSGGERESGSGSGSGRESGGGSERESGSGGETE